MSMPAHSFVRVCDVRKYIQSASLHIFMHEGMKAYYVRGYVCVSSIN